MIVQNCIKNTKGMNSIPHDIVVTVFKLLFFSGSGQYHLPIKWILLCVFSVINSFNVSSMETILLKTYGFKIRTSIFQIDSENKL